MMTKVYLSSRLRAAANNQTWVDIDGGTVQELLDNLTKTFPGIRNLLLKENKLNHFTRVFLNNREVHDLKCPVINKDELHIIQAIAGG